MSAKQRSFFLRTANRRLPPPPDPERDVLKQLGRAGLPLDREAYQSKYEELRKERSESYGYA
jgi:hypothetical protein